MYMSHFFSEPASVLAVELPSPDREREEADSLDDSSGLTASLRSIPSYQRHVQAALKGDRTNSSYEGAVASLQDDTKLLAFVQTSRRAKDRYCATLGSAWSLFETLQETWTEGRAGMDALLTDYYCGKLVDRACRACSTLRCVCVPMPTATVGS